MTLVEVDRPVTGGVDTHLDVHVAAALDPLGGVLGVESCPATPGGYRDLFAWLGAFGPLERVVSKEPVPTAPVWPAFSPAGAWR